MKQAADKKYPFRRIGILYVLALSGIALVIIASQALVQSYIGKQEYDSRVINLAGRQRMLSQKISKLALQIGEGETLAKAKEAGQELDKTLSLWRQTHQGLLHGDKALGVNGEKSAIVDSMYQKITPYYNAMINSGASLLQLLAQPSSPSLAALQPHINNILNNEKQFLEGMDQIVFQYDNEARQRVIQLKNIEFVLLLISLAIIIFELLFIFRPTARKISNTINELVKSENLARSMAREIGILYSSLEKSYQELADVQVEIEQPAVYFKTDASGNFITYSEKFCKIMDGTPDELPQNLFKWLEVEGYGTDHLANIEKMVTRGDAWFGEVKVTSCEGDFLWFNMSVVPVLNVHQKIEELIIVCANVTDKKEAEAKSNEINREKIEKKVKEQRFRSILILEGQEEERKRISRDIHDGIGQMLTAMKFKLEAATLSTNETSREKILADTKIILQQLIREVRRVSFNLTPSTLSDYGIVATVKKLCAELNQLSDKEVIFENRTGFINRLENSVETNLYRIIQEAVNNAIKYSGAKTIKVIFDHNADYLNVEISDDGKGFAYRKILENGQFSATGHGIFNMKERTSFINGSFNLESEEGKGTKIDIHMPLNRMHHGNYQSIIGG